MFRRYFRLGGLKGVAAQRYLRCWLTDLGPDELLEHSDAIIGWLDAPDGAASPLLPHEVLDLGHRLVANMASSEYPDRALDALLYAAQLSMSAGNARKAWNLLTLFRETAGRLELAADSTAVIAAMTLYGRIALARSDYRSVGPPMLRAAMEASYRSGDKSRIADSCAISAWWELFQGSTQVACSLIGEFLEYRNRLDPVQAVTSTIAAGIVLACTGSARLALTINEDLFRRIDTSK